ncbi:hypothetical protein LY76DRAFT_195911 [Colletotrichum caudatum]|nr:hypothetical protein LY76DRAFT_195911 [Colletotrichum caudatum]
MRVCAVVVPKGPDHLVHGITGGWGCETSCAPLAESTISSSARVFVVGCRGPCRQVSCSKSCNQPSPFPIGCRLFSRGRDRGYGADADVYEGRCDPTMPHWCRRKPFSSQRPSIVFCRLSFHGWSRAAEPPRRRRRRRRTGSVLPLHRWLADTGCRCGLIRKDGLGEGCCVMVAPYPYVFPLLQHPQRAAASLREMHERGMFRPGRRASRICLPRLCPSISYERVSPGSVYEVRIQGTRSSVQPHPRFCQPPVRGSIGKREGGKSKKQIGALLPRDYSCCTLLRKSRQTPATA